MASPLAGSGADPWSGPGFGTAPDATNNGRAAETALRRRVQAAKVMIPRRHRDAVRFIRIMCWRTIGERFRSVSSTSIRGNGSDKNGQPLLRIPSRCTAVDKV